MPAVITGKSRSPVMQALRQLEGGNVSKKAEKVDTSTQRVEKKAGTVHVRAAKKEAAQPAPAVKKPRKEKR